MGSGADDVPYPGADARWLLAKWRSDGSIRNTLSTRQRRPHWRSGRRLEIRWQVEQGYQQLKEELRLDHFCGRSWPGSHHHAALCFLTCGFLALEHARGIATALDDGDEIDSLCQSASLTTTTTRPHRRLTLRLTP
jgi:hypothetical protein